MGELRAVRSALEPGTRFSLDTNTANVNFQFASTRLAHFDVATLADARLLEQDGRHWINPKDMPETPGRFLMAPDADATIETAPERSWKNFGTLLRVYVAQTAVEVAQEGGVVLLSVMRDGTNKRRMGLFGEKHPGFTTSVLYVRPE